MHKLTEKIKKLRVVYVISARECLKLMSMIYVCGESAGSQRWLRRRGKDRHRRKPLKQQRINLTNVISQMIPLSRS